MKTATTVTKISTTVQANKTTETVSKQESQKNITTTMIINMTVTMEMTDRNIFKCQHFNF